MFKNFEWRADWWNWNPTTAAGALLEPSVWKIACEAVTNVSLLSPAIENPIFLFSKSMAIPTTIHNWSIFSATVLNFLRVVISANNISELAKDWVTSGFVLASKCKCCWLSYLIWSYYSIVNMEDLLLLGGGGSTPSLNLSVLRPYIFKKKFLQFPFWYSDLKYLIVHVQHFCYFTLFFLCKSFHQSNTWCMIIPNGTDHAKYGGPLVNIFLSRYMRNSTWFEGDRVHKCVGIDTVVLHCPLVPNFIDRLVVLFAKVPAIKYK